MKTPYGKILKTKLASFEKLGFYIEVNDELLVRLTRGSDHIEISTEKFSSPSITSNLINSNGKKFSVRVLRELLDNEKLKESTEELIKIKKIYSLEDRTPDKAMFEAGLELYISTSFDHLLSFLHEYCDHLFPVSVQLRADYSVRNKEALRKIGVLQ